MQNSLYFFKKRPIYINDMRLLKYAYLKNLLFFTTLCFLGGVIHADKTVLEPKDITFEVLKGFLEAGLKTPLFF